MNLDHPQMLVSRRKFGMGLAGSAAACIGLNRTLRALGAEPPPVTAPRATSGDTAVEPAWKTGLTITVGPESDAEIQGNTDRAIQAAVDYVARLGGGTVRLTAGEFELRNAVFLASRVRLVGAAADTVLRKSPSVSTRLAADSDWYDQEITLVDPSGFRVGDGVCLQTTNPHNGGRVVLKRTLVAQNGRRFKLDRPLRENFWLAGDSTASTLFPILAGDSVIDLAIEDLTLDGQKEKNEVLDGNYAGCVFLQDCARIALRRVEARNYNGDGISWQICHDVVVEDCYSHDNTGLGLHPGSGSQRPIIRRNRLVANQIGLFFCWGVKFGLAEENQISDSREVGISFGHRDTDNLVLRNHVRVSGQAGVLFRAERGGDTTANRNRLEENTIEDSGGPEGVAIDVGGVTADVVLAQNVLRETRDAERRIGIRLGPQVGAVEVSENRFAGFATDLSDLRGSPAQGADG